MHPTVEATAALALAIGLVACSHPADSAAGPGDAGAAIGSLSAAEAAQVLVRVGDHTITVGDYVAALQHMDQFDRIRYSAPTRRRELLGEMIDVTLLADEAREKGYDKDPVVQQEIREILRDAILKKAREGTPGPNDISASDVAAYFESHRADFHDPERRRVSAVVLASASAANAALESAVKATPNQWGELVRAKSVDPGANVNGEADHGAGGDVPPDLAGDLGFVSPPGDARGTNTRVPAEVRAAVFEIANVGDVLPRVVTGGGKFYVVKLQSKTAPRDLSLQDAERSIRVRLAQDKARASEDALLDELRKQFPVEVDEVALGTVKVDVPRADGGAP